MTRRHTLGVNITRHHQHRSGQGGILPMGAPVPHVPILPMIPERRSLWAKVQDWRKGFVERRGVVL